MTEPPAYPPEHHLLRDVPIAAEHTGEGRARATLQLVPELLDERGAPRPGVLAYLVDVLGGGLAAVAVAPDWMATTDLTLHWWRAGEERLTASAAVVRRGRHTLVMETALSDGSGEVGRATVTFSILPRRADTIVLPTERPSGASTLALPGSGLDRPLLDRLGVRPGPPAELEMSDYVRNSFGALNGGVVVILADAAASAALGTSPRQLTTHYLGQAKVGPVRATVEVPSAGFARVEVRDAGADRLCALVTAMA